MGNPEDRFRRDEAHILGLFDLDPLSDLKLYFVTLGTLAKVK